MSPTILAFVVGVFVGVMGGIFIIGILQMAREKTPAPPKPLGGEGEKEPESQKSRVCLGNAGDYY